MVARNERGRSGTANRFLVSNDNVVLRCRVMNFVGYVHALACV